MTSAMQIPRPAVDAPEVVCVGRRVDWLTIAFRVRFNRDVLRSFVTTPHERPPRDAPFAVRSYLAKKYRIASVTLPLAGQAPGEEDAGFAMKMIGEGKTILQNRSCRVVLHENAPKSPNDNPNEPGWTVAVEWSGTALIDTDYESASMQSFRIAQSLGEILAVRLRRLDLCADMAGFEIPVPEGHGWCTRPQLRSRKMRAVKRCPVPRQERMAKVKVGRRILKRYEHGEITDAEFATEFPDVDDTYYFPEGNCTGWKFGKGLISARVYDKMAEMRMRVQRAGTAAYRKQAGEKKQAEETWWRLHKWDGKTKVTRVEVQVRGEVLHELDARCDAERIDAEEFAADVGEQLDRVWRYFAGSPDELARRDALPVDADGKCTGCKVKHGSPESCKYTRIPKSGWLRQIVMDGDTRRSDCSHTPGWQAVQAVVFKRMVTTVPVRTRKHGAVRATQVLGCAMALLGFAEQLHHPTDPRTGEVIQDKDEDLHAKELADPGEVDRKYSPAEKKRREELAEAQAKARVAEAVRAQVHDLFVQAGAEVADTLLWIHEDKPEDALTMVWVRMNAAIKRWKPLAKAVRRPDEPANDTEAVG